MKDLKNLSKVLNDSFNGNFAYDKEINSMDYEAKFILYRHIRFFLHYYNKKGAKKINVYDWYFNLLDRYLDGLNYCESNLNKYFIHIYSNTHVNKFRENKCVNSLEILYYLTK